MGIRERLITALLPSHVSPELALHTAARAGFTAVIVDGEYGSVSGSVWDRDSILPAYTRTKTWARRQTAWVADALRHGGTYLDIGGNIGTTVLPIARLPEVTCHVFEPSPLNLTHLRRNLLLNHACAVTVHPVALWSTHTEIAFELDAAHSGDNRVRGMDASGQFGEATREVVEVPARRLDEEVPDLRGPLVIKIDAQGAEPHILTGGARTFAHASHVALEFWPYGLQRLGGDLQGLIDYCCGFPSIAVSAGDSDAEPDPHTPQGLRALLTQYATRTDSQFLDLFLHR